MFFVLSTCGSYWPSHPARKPWSGAGVGGRSLTGTHQGGSSSPPVPLSPAPRDLGVQSDVDILRVDIQKNVDKHFVYGLQIPEPLSK